MPNLKKAAGVALVFTVYIMLFFFIVEVLFVIAHRTTLFQAMYDTFATGTLLFLFVTFTMNEIYRFVDERNRLDELSREKQAMHPPEDLNAPTAPQITKVNVMPPFKQIYEKDWVPGLYCPMAMIDASWDTLESRLSVKFEEYDQDGLGAARGGMFITKTGKQFMIEHLLQAPTSGPHTSIHGLVVAPYDSGFSFDTSDLEEILEATGIASTELTWLHESIKFERHAVWRQDDNGNQFLIRETACKADANHLAAVLTARGHKQMYWVQPASNSVGNPIS